MFSRCFKGISNGLLSYPFLSLAAQFWTCLVNLVFFVTAVSTRAYYIYFSLLIYLFIYRLSFALLFLPPVQNSLIVHVNLDVRILSNAWRFRLSGIQENDSIFTLLQQSRNSGDQWWWPKDLVLRFSQCYSPFFFGNNDDFCALQRNYYFKTGFSFHLLSLFLVYFLLLFSSKGQLNLSRCFLQLLYKHSNLLNSINNKLQACIRLNVPAYFSINDSQERWSRQ